MCIQCANVNPSRPCNLQQLQVVLVFTFLSSLFVFTHIRSDMVGSGKVKMSTRRPILRELVFHDYLGRRQSARLLLSMLTFPTIFTTFIFLMQGGL